MPLFVRVLRVVWRVVLVVFYMLYGLYLIALYRLRLGKNWFDSDRGEAVIQWWSRRVCNVLGLRIRVMGRAHLQRGTLYVANHISWLDIIALSSLLKVRFLAKDNVRRWPLIGWLAGKSGTFFIERGKTFALKQTVSQLRHRLDAGGSVLIFPEGTTTDGAGLAHFHGALFRSVSQSRHAVQTIALRYVRDGRLDRHAAYIGDDSFVGHLLGLTRFQYTSLDVWFMTPFQAQDLTREVITLRCRDALNQALQAMPMDEVAADVAMPGALDEVMDGWLAYSDRQNC